jgi:predicted DNA-binding transcriptional regulator AlpA
MEQLLRRKKFLTKKEVRALICFGYAHIDRMEKNEEYAHLDFPIRVHIGHRVFWVESEILDWMDRQIAKRNTSMQPIGVV